MLRWRLVQPWSPLLLGQPCSVGAALAFALAAAFSARVVAVVESGDGGWAWGEPLRKATNRA